MADLELTTAPITTQAYDRLTKEASMRKRTVAEVLDGLLAEHAYMREEMFRRSAEALARMQAESVRSGTDRMTMDEINEEIASVRSEAYTLANSAS